MKKLFTLLTILFITSTFGQQRLIAVKGTVTDAIANTLSQAIDIAQPGDKIYLPGGFYEHLPAINKQVHIIGTGFQDGQNVMGRTTINGSLTLNDQANGSTFEGFYLTDWFAPATDVSDITFKRCNMLGTLYQFKFDNCIFTNCVVRECLHFGWDGTGTYGINNVITNSFIYRIYRAKYSEIKNCIIKLYLQQCDNVLVKNNVFDYTDTNCNIFYQSGNMLLENNLIKTSCSSVELPGVLSNINTIPYVAINDVFVNATDFSFNPLFNYRLKVDIIQAFPTAVSAGVYVGTNPWKDGSLPIIPNIEQNSSYLDVQAGQFKLNVKVVPQTH